jgi:CMP-N-acetylneuraminic acid synthetase
MKFLCLIPARKNSTRLKNKNFLKFFNKPLVYWTIKIATKSKFFNKIVVSSDNKQLNNIVNKFKKVDFIRRPKSISGKNAKIEESIKHALDVYKRKNEYFDAVVILQPTSPLRKLSTIEKCCKIFSSDKYDTLSTIIKLDSKSHPRRVITLNKGSFFLKKFNYSYKVINNNYRLDGGVVFIKKISSFKNKVLSGNTRFFEIDYPESIDIDTSLDFKQAKLFFKKNDIYK